MSQSLNANSNIAVIGAGASGTIFSIILNQLFRDSSLEPPRITLFDEKQIDKRGIHGCNLCAGVIQPTFLKKISGLGMTLPTEIIREKIYSYKIHTDIGSIDVNPESESDVPILTVFRGIGPLKVEMKSLINFDSFLIHEAIKRGVHFSQAIITNFVLTEKSRKIGVKYYRDQGEETEEFDFCVVACGLNTELLLRIEGLNFGYKKPERVRALQVELEVPQEFYNNVKNQIHIFPIRIGRIKSGIFIPKKNFLTVSLIGEQNITFKEFREFMSCDCVSNFIGDSYVERCCCQPNIAKTSAQNPFTDRLIVIGDAFCCRYYKNGIESAFNTAKIAAHSIFNHGYKRDAMKKFYYKICINQIVLDNYIGQFLFYIDNFILKNKWLLKFLFNQLDKSNQKIFAGETVLHRRDVTWSEPNKSNIYAKTKIRRIAWQYLTGTERFLKILKQALDFRFIIFLLKKLFIKEYEDKE